jgi:hypothetical protein
MTYRQLPFPVTQNVIWDNHIELTAEGFRVNGIKEFGIQVQQAGLQEVLYKFEQLGFVPYTTIKTDIDPNEDGDIERYVLVLREKSTAEKNERHLELKYEAIDAIREFNCVNERYANIRYEIPSLQYEELLKAACKSEALTIAYSIIAGESFDSAAEYLHKQADAKCPKCGGQIDHRYNCCSTRNCDRIGGAV